MKSKVLVIYYSLGGTTRKVAEKIAEKLKCEIEEITEPKSRKGIIGFIRSRYGSVKGKTSILNPLKTNPADYDVVIVGGPTWAGTVSVPVRTYLKQFGGQIKQVMHIGVSGGVEKGKLFQEMTQWSKSPLAILDLTQKEVQKDLYGPKLEEFLKQIP